MEIFRGLSREGMTIIMITHEPSIAACADKTYHILDGRLRTDGGEVRPEEDPEPAPGDDLAELHRLLDGTGKED